MKTSSGLTRRHLIGAGAGAVTAAAFPFAGPAEAQGAWPNKPIKIIAGYPAGGQTDLFARSYGDYVSRQVGQPVLVENKAGAGGTVGALEVKRAAPDGYTWMFTISTTLIMNRALMKNLPYDTEKDFILISIMPSGSLPLVASAKTGAKNLKEFVDYARKADKVSVGTYAAGSYAHMAVAELNKQYGLKIEPVHYRGEAPMWADLSSGVTQAACSTLQGATPAIQAGNATPVAVPTKTRSRRLPNVATFAEQGATHPYFLLESMVCCVAPTGTPRPIVEALSAGMVEMNRTPRLEQFVDQFGLDQGAQGWQDFAAFIRDMGPLLTAAVKELNITPQ